MPNPLVGFVSNRSRRQDAERPTPIAPLPEHYAGDNLPYRGTEQHGVSVAEDWRDPAEDGPLPPDGRLVDVYEPEEKGHDPIPVYIVNSSASERRAFRVVTAYAGGSNFGKARQIIGRDERRTKATIRCPEWGSPIYLSDTPEGATDKFGFPLLAGQTYVTESQDDVYAFCPAAPDDQLTQVAVEYRISLDG